MSTGQPKLAAGHGRYFIPNGKPIFNVNEKGEILINGHPSTEKITYPKATDTQFYYMSAASDTKDDVEAYPEVGFRYLKHPLAVKVTYDPNGGLFKGSTDVISELYLKGTQIEIAKAAEREGYNFLYWRGKEGQFKPNEKYLVLEDCTFTAQWEATSNPPVPNTQACVTFDANGGTFVDNTSLKTYYYDLGTEITIIDAPTREGYTFDYWKGSEFRPGDKFTVEGDHTFTAQWKVNNEPSNPEPSDLPEIVLPVPTLPSHLTVSAPAVVKQIKGGQPAQPDNLTFRFEGVNFTPANQNANLPSPQSVPLPSGSASNSKSQDGQAILIQIQGAKSGTFGQITYTQPGDYTYKITEVPNPDLPYIFDNTVYTFTDHVNEQGGELVSTRTFFRNGQPINSITAYFTNEYTGPNNLQDQIQNLPATGERDSLSLGLTLLSLGLAVFVVRKPRG